MFVFQSKLSTVKLGVWPPQVQAVYKKTCSTGNNSNYGNLTVKTKTWVFPRVPQLFTSYPELMKPCVNRSLIHRVRCKSSLDPLQQLPLADHLRPMVTLTHAQNTLSIKTSLKQRFWFVCVALMWLSSPIGGGSPPYSRFCVVRWKLVWWSMLSACQFKHTDLNRFDLHRTNESWSKSAQAAMVRLKDVFTGNGKKLSKMVSVEVLRRALMSTTSD